MLAVGIYTPVCVCIRTNYTFSLFYTHKCECMSVPFIFFSVVPRSVRNKMKKKKNFLAVIMGEKRAPVCYIIYISCSGNLHPRKNKYTYLPGKTISAKHMLASRKFTAPSTPLSPTLAVPAPPCRAVF